MAHIDALIDKVADPALRQALREQVDGLLDKKSFGLVYQQHQPETVELPHFRVQRGCKVRVRSEDDGVIYRVQTITKRIARIATLSDKSDHRDIAISNLTVVREFGDPVFPGLRSTGRIERGGDKPFHILLSAENFHALETLLYTHEQGVDAIYIDPPYNTRDKDWKYNNNYVDPADRYRHSKWLAMMERRLKLAARLLKPERSVLIITIDDNEVNRLGLLLEQIFSGHDIQLVTSVVNPRGQYRDGGFSRCDEFIYFVTLGTARVSGEPDEDFSEGASVPWRTLRRSDASSARGTPKGGPNQFFPIYVNDRTGAIERIGPSLDPPDDRTKVPRLRDCTAVFPIRDDGTEMNWGVGPALFEELRGKGYIRVGRAKPGKPQAYEISYYTSGRINDITSGRARVVGHNSDGSVIAQYVTHKLRMPLSNWWRPSHNAETGGTNVLKALMGRNTGFPYPKSVYAIEDALRYFIGDLPNAVVVDFFAGSGTTTHAVARLNRQDGGRRQSILVTNNEVSDAEARALRAAGYFPGDEEWETEGICKSITIPRVRAALTGTRPDGRPVDGEYKYIDEGPMSEGFDENAEFFELTYEDADLISLGRKFSAIAPLLWLKAGSQGARIDEQENEPWVLPKGARYGVLFAIDQWRAFVDAIADRLEVVHAFLVTDSHAAFQQVASELPSHISSTQLYGDYLRTFEINTKGRA